MVAQRRINRHLLLPPHAGLAVPGFPVVQIIAVVDHVSTKGHKRGTGAGYGLNQRLARSSVRRFGVFRIMEACVSVSNKTERDIYR